MLRIGLTGGIGSGKSTIAALFARHGTPIIDTDEIARRLAEPGAGAYDAIVAAFGDGILDAGRRVDRSQLRVRVFNDPEERKRLEAILHPRIREEVRRQLAELDAPYCIVVVPLLIESGFDALIDRILVVDTPEALQIARATARGGLTEPEVRAVMAAQTSRAERLQKADDVIVNDADMTHLEREIERLHALYVAGVWSPSF
ncbi:MAG: dephospho-CoA kinase [Candidatus Muproteobacteria bacterium RBG_16_65_34]|uniref:Dephospho-CoA kinase n=1 Tax=Candidatus Muproteobacteria bacterium RBG_16_65_34 TaxID=1817760 RepID=A0A1F6TUQ2_9PROT|nr:MAG: dephospho-CoA kinase [Candidatus Muproteobacteria bacterium RBG_16_65_34]